MEAIPFVLLGVAVVAAGAIFIWQRSRAKGRWGIGSLSASCPRCGSPMPMIRKPTSMQEALWGGWTCAKCGCKVDKYGRERTAA